MSVEWFNSRNFDCNSVTKVVLKVPAIVNFFSYGWSIFSITYVDFCMYKALNKLQYMDAMEKIIPPLNAE